MSETEIKQTSDAILLESFNDNIGVASLKTMLSNAENVESVQMPEFADDVKRTLGVSSFKEFMDKFAPDIYEIDTFETDENGQTYYYATYTTDGDKSTRLHGRKVALEKDTYFRTIEELYSKKGAGLYSNSEFQDEIGNKLLEYGLSIKKSQEDIKNTRKNLAYLTSQYEKANKEGKDAKPYAKKIIDYRKKIISQTNSLMQYLPLAMSEASQQLECLEQGMNSSAQNEETKKISSKNTLLLQPGHTIQQGGDITTDEKGALTFQLVKNDVDGDQDNPNTENDINSKIRGMIVADYEINHPKNQNEFVKSLVVNAYAPTDRTASIAQLSEQEKEEQIQALEVRKKQYEICYQKTKENFVKEMTEIIEKIMGVKVFFDHATAQGGIYGTLESKYGLIVANCKPTDLISSDLKDKFAAYIENIGVGKGNDKCWFGILPAVSYDNSSVTDDFSIDDLEMGIDMSQSAEDDQKKADNILDIASATEILKIMDDGHILTVFNFQADKSNVFNSITASSIREKKRLLENINFAHAVYAYPDFTLVQYHRTAITETSSIQVPEIHIDAAYPAAGLLVASQQESCLKAHGLGDNIITDRPHMSFVRIDLEKPLLREHMTTKFNKENIMNWNKSVTQEIKSDMFGFAFCGNAIHGNIKNTYVLTARTLQKMKNNQYQPIYCSLLIDYIYEVLDSLGGEMQQVKDILLGDEYLGTWKDAAKEYAEDNKINLVLNPGEDIHLGEDNTITINFENVGTIAVNFHIKTNVENKK